MLKEYDLAICEFTCNGELSFEKLTEESRGKLSRRIMIWSYESLHFTSKLKGAMVNFHFEQCNSQEGLEGILSGHMRA